MTHQYKLAVNWQSITDFEAACSKLLTAGWQPVGGVQFLHTPEDGPAGKGGNDSGWAQAFRIDHEPNPQVQDHPE